MKQLCREGVVDFVANNNLFISGGAGTGKTYLIKELAEKLSSNRVVYVVAPTAQAAQNVLGRTLNSFFHLPPKIITSADAQKIVISSQSLREKLALVDYLIVDEVSMVLPSTLDAIDIMLRTAREDNTPLGGVRIILCGDMAQLPPVVQNTKQNGDLSEREVLTRVMGYKKPDIRFAHVWGDLNMARLELQHPYRQQSDSEYAHSLGIIRRWLIEGNDDELSQAITYFNDTCLGKSVDNPISLCMTRKDATRINQEALYALPGREVAFEYEGGIFPKGTRAAEMLVLKNGMKVIFISNDPDHQFRNGDTGTIQAMNESEIVVKLSSNEVIEVQRFRYSDTQYRIVNGKLISTEANTVFQFPILPCEAITVHACQGLTLDIVRVYGEPFESGQMYTAISRTKNSQNLSLASRLFSNSFLVQ